MTQPLQSISGLASGIDTNAIISELMSIEKQPQIRIQQRITVEQSRQQQLRDVLTQLQSLQTAYQALTDPGTWASVESVSSNNESYVSATSDGTAAPGAYTVDVTALASANQYTLTPAAGVTTAAAADTLHIQMANQASPFDVAIDAGDSLDTIASRINGTQDTPVYASVVNGTLVLSDKTTGTAAKISGVTIDGGSGFNFTATETQGAQDASFDVTVGGKTSTYTSASNVASGTLPGLTLTLKGIGSATVLVGTPGPDTSAIESKVQSFVSQYNATIGFIQSKLDEQTVPNPQNDADRTKGLLNGDLGLESLLSSLRNAFSDTIQSSTSAYQWLSQVGLSTGAAVGTDPLSSDSIDGKMTLDTSTFESALTNHFDDVKALFTNPTGSYSTEGLADRLKALVDPWTADSTAGGVLNSRIDGETSTITELQSESSDWDTRLALRQQMLQSQFTAMETALSQAQSQSSWLTGEIAKLG